MARGHSTARFRITALPPAKHAFDVRVIAPTSADVRVRIRTWYGQLLHLLDSTRDKQSCEDRGNRLICLVLFPRLEAQRERQWTVIVTKRSTPRATTRVEVTFGDD
jgi:hypothetical protein